ncbi:MAG: tRNA preQ1(34) S-adenosylmethionine ribosyltransferase-isomerase QueA [Planctomycetota bacterium]
MRTEELDFDLPRELIATRPAEPRDSARLLVVRKDTHEHRTIRELPEILNANDTLVFNATRVLPARFRGHNEQTGGKVEGLWLRDAEPGPAGERRWEVMLKARRHRAGAIIGLERETGEQTGVRISIVERSSHEEGGWIVDVHTPPDAEADPTEAVLALAGMTPLPPYILSRRKEAHDAVDDAFDRAAYQTIFADDRTRGGSVAAPTAGLHFTPRLLGQLEAAGVRRTTVTLHVGAGTFKGIETDTVEDHEMHAEWCTMNAEARDAVFGALTSESDRRVIAVGSTSTRTIESYAAVHAERGSYPDWLETRLMITPGYRWQRVGAVLTNFHLPRSTLIAMVAAAVPGGIERVRGLYAEAIAERYRFFSYGDAMLILPEG